ncbi:hypothetical protein [Actinomyces lilanjuaniae]|uniref:hypothetical protein n=1 Tax=Actinomyces lilanjuaniae TaxID=2321394 RepID=UPI0013C45F0D|nr:hypothetical protein [Actinomyces lilanjuaniae]
MSEPGPAPTPPVDPSAGAATPSQPQTPAAAARQATFAALVRQPGLISFALVQAVVLGGALLSALLLMAATSEAREDLNLPASLSALLVLMGAALGGQLSITATFFIQVSATVTVLPLGTLLAIGCGVYLVARRRAPVDGSSLHRAATLQRCAVEALATGLLLGLLTGLPRAGGDSGDGLSVSSSPLPTVVLVSVVVMTALSAARLDRAAVIGLPIGLRQAGREVWALLVSLGTVTGAVTLVAGTAWALAEGVPQALALLIVYLPNLVVVLLSLATLGGLVARGEVAGLGVAANSSEDSLVTVGDLPVGAVLLLVVTVLLATVVAAARVGVLRARSRGAVLARTWPLAVAALALSVPLLYVLVPARMSGGGEMVSASAMPSGWSFITVSLLACVVSVLAEYLPAWLYANANQLLRVMVGTRAVTEWVSGRSSLGGSMGVAQGTGQAGQAEGSHTWSYGTDPATGAATATDLSTGALFVEDASTGQWVLQGHPASGSPVSASAEVADPVSSDPVSSDLAAPGQQAPAPTASQQAQALPEPQPMSPQARRRMRLVLGTAGLLLVLVVVGMACVNFLNGRRGPDQEVEAYLDLLSQGRAEAATQMVDPGVPNSQRALLNDEALAAATSRVEVVTVSEPQVEEDTAKVSTTLSLDGEHFDFTFTVARGDRQYGLLDTWEVTTPLVVPVTFSSADGLDAISVAGTDLALEASEEEYSSTSTTLQYVYAGTYDVGVPQSLASYLTAETSSLIALPASAAADMLMEVTSEPTQELEDLVLEEVKAQTESCASVPGNTDAVCPSEVQDTDLASLKVTQDASGLDEVTASSFASEQIIISVTQNPSQWNKDPKPRSVRFTFSGSIEWPEGGGEPEVTVDSSSPSWG